MIEKVENRLVFNITMISLILLLLFSSIFYIDIEIFLNINPHINNSTPQVHFIDVGQGDAIAIKFNNKLMLIDSGIEEYRSKLANYIDNVLISNKTIDYLVLTHLDKDHISNMEYLLNNYNVKNFYRPYIYEKSENKLPYVSNNTYKNILNILHKKHIKTFFNKEGLKLKINNSYIEWIYPYNDMKPIENNKTNNLSPVMIMQDNGVKLMLTGDIDSKVEKDLILNYKNKLDIDILKLAHHGSKYSTCKEFLEATSPKKIIITTGENTYGHPANETLKRILDYDNANNTSLFNNTYSTKDYGNIIINIDKELNKYNIDNIDNYSFISYYIYVIIFVLMLLFFILKPYIKTFIKNYKFKKRNLEYKLLKDKSSNT